VDPDSLNPLDPDPAFYVNPDPDCEIANPDPWTPTESGSTTLAVAVVAVRRFYVISAFNIFKCTKYAKLAHCHLLENYL
jgi:hypothetical protein